MATVKKAKQAAELSHLPFDQYSRQFVVAKLIESLRPANDTPLRIIDLGGHKGKTADFLPHDRITVLDVYDESYPGYVKGDATALTYKDNSFDIACSFDVFEHIPRQKRQAFLNEALRVSKLGVFITMPVDTTEGAVSAAENLLNDIHRSLYTQDHPWLKEHIDYRIPNDSEVTELIKAANAHHTSVASNQITDWEMLQTLIFVAAKNPHATQSVQALNQWYNQHIDALESQVQTGYRRVYFVSRDEGAVKTVEATAHVRPKSAVGHYVQIHRATFQHSLVAMADIGRSFIELHQAKQQQDEQVAHLQARAGGAETRQTELEREIYNVTHSLSWRITQPLRSIMNAIRRLRAVK